MRFDRVVAVLTACCLVSGLVAAATYEDPPERVETSTEAAAPTTAQPRTTTDPTATTVVPISTTSTPTTTEPAPAATTPVTAPSPPVNATTAPATTPPADVLMIDRPGVWVVRADGSDAIFHDSVGEGGPRGYGGQWGPDSAMYGIKADGSGRTHLLRTTVSGEERWFDLPTSPPISDDIGPAPRWIQDFRVFPSGIAFTWMRDDGFSGASFGSHDLSQIIEFDDDGFFALALPDSRGERFASGDAEGITVIDAQSRVVAGPYPMSRPNGVGPVAWRDNDSAIMVGDGTSYCLLDLASGRCPWRQETYPEHAQLSPVDDTAVAENLRVGTTTTLSVVRPGVPELLLTDYGEYPVWHAEGTHIAFGRSPYLYDDQTGPASVHIIGADGSGERLLANTRNHVAFPWGWSPDGQWIGVSVGGPI